jgi:ribosomal protein S18 acetylase RimI-like enzyme
VSIVLRSGSVSDARAVLVLWAEADAEPTHTDDIEGITRLIETDGEALIVAETDGEIIGSVIAGWDGWRGSIHRLVVAKSHRRQGLGRRLLAEAESRLAARGARRVSALVVADDPQATGYWRATGWKEQKRRLRFVKG